MKRILVTRGAGFLGSHPCDHFIEVGYEEAKRVAEAIPMAYHGLPTRSGIDLSETSIERSSSKTCFRPFLGSSKYFDLQTVS
jgi:hypothetical protein